MPPVARRRPTLAIAGSALAHLAVLAIAVAQHPTIPIPDTPEAPSPDAITVQLVRRPPAVASRAQTPLRLHRGPTPLSEAGPPIALLPAPPASRPGAEPAPSTPGAVAGPDLRLGVAGCANAAATGMSRAERDLCNERLGRGMAKEQFLPAAIDGRVRAYDAVVAEAKAPDPQQVRLVAQGGGGAGAAGMFSVDDRVTNSHGPHIYCSIHFGVGKQPKPRPHALTLGHCNVEPPKGPLDPEVDITSP